MNSLKWKIDEKTRHHIATGASETKYTCVVLGKNADDQPAWALLIQQGNARYSRCGLESVAAARDLAERHDANGGGQVAIACLETSPTLDRRSGTSGGFVAHALRREGHDASEDGTGRGTPLVIPEQWRVRRLLPVECERLQGMPDGWTAIQFRGKPAADGPRYKAIGNSWAVPCAAWVEDRIRKALEAAK